MTWTMADADAQGTNSGSRANIEVHPVSRRDDPRPGLAGTASSIARIVWAENLRPEGVHVRLNAYIEPAEVGCNETLSPIFLTNLLGLGQENRFREDSGETGFW